MKAIYTIALIVILTGYTSNAMPSEIARVTGTLTYPHHTVLPPHAVIYLTLVDISSRQDVLEEIIARQTITNPGRMPIAFNLEYNPARISSNHAYAIQAHITVNGKLLFINTSPYRVITQGKPNAVDMIVNPAK